MHAKPVKGVARFATPIEADAGANPDVMVNPVELQRVLSESPFSTKKVYEIIGDNANDQYEFNHALNTKNIVVSVMADTGSLAPYPVEVYWQPKPTVTTNWIQIFFPANVATDFRYEVTIIG